MSTYAKSCVFWLIAAAIGTSPVGAIFGFFFGLVVAFFVAPVFLLGGNLPDQSTLTFVFLGVPVAVLLLSALAALLARRREWLAAVGLAAIHCCGALLFFWLCVESLQRAWP